MVGKSLPRVLEKSRLAQLCCPGGTPDNMATEKKEPMKCTPEYLSRTSAETRILFLALNMSYTTKDFECFEAEDLMGTPADQLELHTCSHHASAVDFYNFKNKLGAYQNRASYLASPYGEPAII